MIDAKNMLDGELLNIIKDARNEIARRQEEETYENTKHTLGCFFKSENCYSANKESDYWDVYSYVTDVKRDGNFVYWSFEKDINGNIRFNFCAESKHLWLLGERISKAEFMKAYSLVKSDIGKLVQDCLVNGVND